MRFEFYHSGIDTVPKLSVDGTVANSIHFSHWEGNETPVEVKADTSTEIALKLVGSPNRQNLTQGIDLVTNNHFDTDGVLSVWTMLNGERALEKRDKLISAAEAGDFSELTSDDGVRTSLTIQGPDPAGNDSDSGSPLANLLNGSKFDDDARAYELVLPEVENILNNINAYEPLWRSGWDRIARAVESFEKGSSSVTEFSDVKLSLVTIAPEAFGSGGFDPTQPAIPYIAVSRYATGHLFLIATPYKHGWSYRIDYPYYSWAETIVRPAIQRRDFTGLVRQLNEREPDARGWQLDSSEMASAVKFREAHSAGTSRQQPDDVAAIVRAELLARSATVA